MRENKCAIIWTSLIGIASLLLAFVFEYRCECMGFYVSLFLGIFGSDLLAFILAVISYRVERRRTMEKFYEGAQRAASNYNRFENDGDLDRTVDILLQMDRFDYTMIDTAWGEMSFFFRNAKTKEYIYNKIYGVTIVVRHAIRERARHFREYSKPTAPGTWKNTKAIQALADEIDAIIMHRWNYGDPPISCSENDVVIKMRTELGGHYYDLMYPHCKEEEKNAD